MTKPKERVVRTIVILLMLGASPLSVTYSFADMEDDQGNKMIQRCLIVPKMRNLK
ncbi:MAG: hypothetical protein OEL81_09275 [Nitrosopumilus sp.]|nr:hypothetical protein [Nitrosopumilus sp.]MDH3765834.1 hypothetical protein [Nitrosopumilus sp.]